MQNILNLQRRGYLTEQQLLHAFRFQKNPNSYNLAPTLYRVLHDTITRDEPLEAMEKRRGWPARSAKAIIGLILHSMQEMQGSHADDPEDATETTAKEKLAFVVADDPHDTVPLSTAFKLTHREARLFLILQRAGTLVSKETLLNRLYHDQIDEAPDAKIIDVFVCKIRSKVAGSRWRIDTVWGEGYRLVDTDDPNAPPAPRVTPPRLNVAGTGPKADNARRNLVWYKAHVYDEESLRSIARREGVQPSTVMRVVQRLANDNTDDELDEAVKKLTA